jgi:hypothetical protein
MDLIVAVKSTIQINNARFTVVTQCLTQSCLVEELRIIGATN